MKKVLAVVAVSTAAVAFAANAQDLLLVRGFAPTFGGETVQRQVGIKIADLNPADKDGAATLYTRITHAADVVCSGGVGGKSALLAAKAEKCRNEAVARAVHDIGTPELRAAASGQ